MDTHHHGLDIHVGPLLSLVHFLHWRLFQFLLSSLLAVVSSAGMAPSMACACTTTVASSIWIESYAVVWLVVAYNACTASFLF